MSHFATYQSPSQTSSLSKLLNNNRNTSRYFNNINEKSVYKKYTNTKANSNKCSRNNSCRKQTSTFNNKNKLTKTKAKIGLQTLSYGYKKKIISILKNMIGLIKSKITKKEIVEIANSLDILNTVYNEHICESGMSMSLNTKNNSFSRHSSRNTIDIYQYLTKQMKDKIPTIATEKLSLFINNIKNSNKTTTNTKSKTDSDYEDIMNNNNNNLKSVFKSVLETLPDCKTS